MKYDYLVVGAGIYGATMARQLTDSGKRVLIVEKRNNIGGNCYDEFWNGIPVHLYGAHVFHTNSDRIWEYVNRFSSFYPYRTKAVSLYRGKMYSFPINMMTFNQVYGVTTPEELKHLLDTQNSYCAYPDPIPTMGLALFEMLFKGYTEKQWGMPIACVPAHILKRIPVRLTYDDRRFDDKYEALPTQGFTALIKNMIDGIDLCLGVDYIKEKDRLNALADKVVYSGKIDGLFDYRFGKLGYRSLHFSYRQHKGDYQGVFCVNHPSADVEYTRSIEFKHLLQNPSSIKHSIVMHEYPRNYTDDNEPFYPINTEENNNIAQQYLALAEENGIIAGGRLGSFRYYDMDQSIGMALKDAQQEINSGL